MAGTLSANTKAILLLTAPLSAGSRQKNFPLVPPDRYQRLARLLYKSDLEPADFLGKRRSDSLAACREVLSEADADVLLGRGLQLGQAVEQWHARSIWVVSRADPEYPQKLRKRFLWEAPALLYGCGDMSLLDAGGLAVVGPQKVDEKLAEEIEGVASLAGLEGRTIVSGGPRGAGQVCVQASLDAGGTATVILADSLDREALDRAYRDALMDKRLVLVSPYDPGGRPAAVNAVKRNKFIYGLADAGLVLGADFNKGEVWAGAVEQLDLLKMVPIYVRLTEKPSKALEALRKKGALSWPQPCEAKSFHKIFEAKSGEDAPPEEAPPTYIQGELPFGKK